VPPEHSGGARAFERQSTTLSLAGPAYHEVAAAALFQARVETALAAQTHPGGRLMFPFAARVRLAKTLLRIEAAADEIVPRLRLLRHAAPLAVVGRDPSFAIDQIARSSTRLGSQGAAPHSVGKLHLQSSGPVIAEKINRNKRQYSDRSH